MKSDSDGFVTLHRGRTPLLQRVATVLLLVFIWVLFWKVVG